MSRQSRDMLITDKKLQVSTNTTSTDYFEADVQTVQDYYAFGMQMPGRKLSGGHPYGFNGKENDKEVKGEGNQQDYGMRLYDGRIGKFLSVDPLTPKYPELTPYQFASNIPISGIDRDGLEFYYAANGQYLGHRTADGNGKSLPSNVTNSVRLANKVIESQNLTIYQGVVDLHISHEDFQQGVTIVKHEGDTKDENEYIGLAFQFNNNAKLHNRDLIKTLKRESSVFRNDPEAAAKRYSPSDNSIRVISSRKGMIAALSGGVDPTNGATQNDGNDFLSWGLTQGPWHGGKHAKFTEYSFIFIDKKILETFKNNVSNNHKSGLISYTRWGINKIPLVENVFKDPANFDSDGNFRYNTGVKNKKSLVAGGTGGESIFWRVEKK